MGSFDGGRGGFSRLVALALLGLELVDHEGNFGVLSLARRGLGRNTLGKSYSLPAMCCLAVIR